MKKILPFVITLLSCFSFSAQDINYAREVLKVLTDKDLYGRGYVNKGDSLAAEFLAAEFQKHGLLPLDSSYFQQYTLSMNTFPGKIKVKLDGKKIDPGLDYVLSSSNPALKGKYSLHYLPDTVDSRDKLMKYLEENRVEAPFLVTDNDSRDFYGFSMPGVKGIIVRTEKMPWWHVSNGTEVGTVFWLKVRKAVFPEGTNEIYVKVENEFIPNYPARNVAAYVKGRKFPDRFIVFTAHYDHLGMMGKKTYFPGANDNGSGTAMLLDLARYYAQTANRPDYSIAFLAFSGEEAGLFGSKYYVEHPLFDLRAIRLLVNLDMVGTGSEGITVVNGKAYKELYDKMVELNQKKQYIPAIKARGEACNSDHCPFYNTGVKSIFIYTMGSEYLEYHNVADNAETLPLTAYEGLFKLLADYLQYVN